MTLLAATLLLSAMPARSGAHIFPTISFGHTYTMPGPAPLAIAAAPTGSKIAVGFEDGTVRIIDVASHKTLRVFKQHPQPVWAVAWSSDGVFVASGDESARVFVWNAITGDVKNSFRAHVRGIQSVSFNREHSLLLSTGKDDVIKIYDLKLNKPIGTIPGSGVNFYGARFDPYLNTFATGDLTNGARIYRTDGVPVRFLNGHGGQGVLDLDYSPSGKQIITGGKDATAIVWDTKSGKKTGTLRGHEDWVMRAAFAPSEEFVATSSNDRTVRLWDTKTLKQVAELKDESAVGSPVRFTADGKYLISSSVSDQLQFTQLLPGIKPEVVATAKPHKKTAVRHRRIRRRR